MLGQIGETPYDLRFSLLGIPVRVHPLFWVAAAILGWPNKTGPETLAFVLVWAACLFVSILVHELGHAWMARHYGWPPEVVLYHMGGYTLFHPTVGHTTSRAVKVLLAGPGAGFILYGLVEAFTELCYQSQIRLPELAQFAILQLEWINLWWGLVNLLPVFPLDGGQISRHLLTAFRPREGLALSLQLSIGVAAVLAVFLYSLKQPFAAILFALLCFESVQAYQQTRGRY